MHKPASHSVAIYDTLDRTVKVRYVCGRCASAYRKYVPKAKIRRYLIVKGLDLRTDDPEVEALVYPKSS